MARSRYLSGPMTTVSADIVLHPIGGEERTLEELTSLFHLVVVAIDPYEYESSWILATAGRILTEYEEADCRVAWLVTAPEEDAVTFLGPWAERMLTLCDPNRIAVNALGITEIPALVHIGTDRSIVGKADGWDPEAWKPITDNLARVMSWSRSVYPKAGDPAPFRGSPVGAATEPEPAASDDSDAATDAAEPATAD